MEEQKVLLTAEPFLQNPKDYFNTTIFFGKKLSFIELCKENTENQVNEIRDHREPVELTAGSHKGLGGKNQMQPCSINT